MGNQRIPMTPIKTHVILFHARCILIITVEGSNSLLPFRVFCVDHHRPRYIGLYSEHSPRFNFT